MLCSQTPTIENAYIVIAGSGARHAAAGAAADAAGALHAAGPSAIRAAGLLVLELGKRGRRRGGHRLAADPAERLGIPPRGAGNSSSSTGKHTAPSEVV